MAALEKPFLAAVSGVKNSGKTTFLEKLVKALTGRGLRVAVLKHDGHEFAADREGTDTYRMQQAGAFGTCIFSGSKWQAVKQEQGVSLKTLTELFPEADLILVEGMKDSDLPKFELVRKGVSKESVCKKESLLGLVTDTELQIPGVPRLGFEEIERCAELLVRETGKNAERKEQTGGTT